MWPARRRLSKLCRFVQYEGSCACLCCRLFCVVPVCCQADIVKEIFKVMPKFSDTPMPPLDEEMLADLAKIPAKLDGECQPW